MSYSVESSPHLRSSSLLCDVNLDLLLKLLNYVSKINHIPIFTDERLIQWAEEGASVTDMVT